MRKIHLLTLASALILGLSSFLIIAPPAMQATLTADKMNVFYVGVDNPISVSVSDIDPSLVSIDVSGGTAQGGKGKYTINCTAIGNCVIDVFAKTDKGNEKVNSFTFRSKRIPDPTTRLGTIVGDGQMTKAELSTQVGIHARLDNFDFNTAFSVQSFTATVANENASFSRFACTGPTFTSELKNAIASMRLGSYLLITDVTVKGPDNVLRKINGVVVKVR